MRRMITSHPTTNWIVVPGVLVFTLGGLLSIAAAGAASNKLQPSPLGGGQCSASEFHDGSVYAQIALADTNCSVVASVASGSDAARGAKYISHGFTCSAVKEGPTSKWASAWGGTYYAYSCADGNKQAAFNWGTDYVYGSSSATTTPIISGHLQPAPLGSGQCQATRFKDGSTYAQIAVAGTSCSVAAAVGSAADQARGAAFHSEGYSCVPTREGAKSKWVSAWGGTYYAYSCANGSRQVAFNWGTDYIY